MKYTQQQKEISIATVKRFIDNGFDWEDVVDAISIGDIDPIWLIETAAKSLD